MKTVELRKYYKILSELNNSLTHYCLVWSQFEIDYATDLEEKSEVLTKDYFKKNPHKRMHNIKLGALEMEHKKTNNTLIKGIFLLAYTYFECYLKEIISFAQKIDDSILSLENKSINFKNDSTLIDKVLNRIEVDKNGIEEVLLETLDYLRLKRNRLIHSNVENVSNSLNELIKNKGNKLNDYWNNTLQIGRASCRERV